MLDLFLFIASLFVDVVRYEDGSAIIDSDAYTINIPAFDSAGDTITIEVK